MRATWVMWLLATVACGGGGARVTADADPLAPDADLLAPDADLLAPDAGAPPDEDAPIGYAAVAGRGLDTTTGAGPDAEVVTVATADEFEAAAEDDTPRVVQVSGTIEGNLSIGSNKTVVGLPGGTLRGSVQINDAQNVIVRDLIIVGWNCSDVADCGDGLDALVVRRSHHLWFDHLDISDGSDGNFDMRDGDYVTISWCKFHYSPERDPGSSGDPHRFSNGLSSDALVPFYVTMHHNWWSENVFSRMPRVSYGVVHVYNNLMWSPTAESCAQLAGDASMLVEHNHFKDVDDPLKIGTSVNAGSFATFRDNFLDGATGDQESYGDQARVVLPSYPYSPEPAQGLLDAIVAGAGPRR
jgi:pectate lyase